MASKIQIFKGYWRISDVVSHPNWLFVYGDNDQHRGKGGQAIIRFEPNTMGIPTKKYPSFSPDAYYTDNEYILNMVKIKNAVNNVIDLSSNYEAVILPENGFGTGLANLPAKAPRTHSYLINVIEQLMEII